MGKREFRQVLTMVRRLCGQPSTGPSGVRDQSKLRMSTPVSPPPARGPALDSACGTSMRDYPGWTLDPLRGRVHAFPEHAFERHEPCQKTCLEGTRPGKIHRDCRLHPPGSMREHRDPVRHVERLVSVVRDEDHRLAALLPQAGERVL